VVIVSVALLFSCVQVEEPSPKVSAPRLEDLQGNLVGTRPEWEGQLNLEDIKPGWFVYEVGKNFKTQVLLLSEPYLENGQCVYERVVWEDGAPWEYYTSEFCSDYGLTEYSGVLNGWNPYNHLLPTEKAPYTKEALEDLKSTLRPDPSQLPDPNYRLPETLLL
jgi:hypothetical protein